MQVIVVASVTRTTLLARRLVAACMWMRKVTCVSGKLVLGGPVRYKTSKLHRVVYHCRTQVYNIDPFVLGIVLLDGVVISALATHFNLILYLDPRRNSISSQFGSLTGEKLHL